MSKRNFITSENEKCVFADFEGFCKALSEVRCHGTNTSCSFYKTEIQLNEALNRSILLNRMKGKCLKCKYRDKPCELSKIKDLEE